MPADAWRTASGVAVLVAGVTTAMTLNGGVGGPSETSVAAVAVPAPVTTVSTAMTVIETSAPVLPGVPDAVTRILQWNGNTGFANQATQAEIPPAVVDALVAYGVPIAVPSSEASG